MSRCIIQIWTPDELAGQYLKTFDFHTPDGKGYGEFTLDCADAKIFDTVGQALEFWRTVSKTKPLRADGRPNRPLTASTVEIIKLGDHP